MGHCLTLIAPVSPFRGGIARHSEALGQAIANTPDILLTAESFARLYPRRLYPGTSDRDENLAGTAPFPVRFDIDTLNPLSWRNAAERVALRGGAAIMPAWTFFVAPTLGTIARRVRARGVRVVMIVHNAMDHETSQWKTALSSWQLKAADGFVTHTSELAEQLREAGLKQPSEVIEHPVYSDFPSAQGSLPRERKLELLCFGLVRNYKGVDIALRSLARSGLEDVRLTVAGEIWDDGEQLRRLANSSALAGKVELIDRYVSDQEAAELFARCDAVLAPYRSVTGSGVAAMARHYARPLIASDLPGLAKSVSQDQSGWLFDAGNEAALADLLRSEVTRESACAMAERIRLCPGDDGWRAYADAVIRMARLS